MDPIKAVVVATNQEFFERQAEAWFSRALISLEKPGRILCECPCGCGGTMNLPVYREGEPKPATTAWMLSGTPEAPSLGPSVRDVGSCYFHGHLNDGIWTFCGDSGVKQVKQAE